MGLENFIPVVWSARLLKSLRKTHVYGQEFVINRDYEGEILGAGSSVKISSIGEVSVKNYSKNANIDDPEELSDAQTTLLIDQQKYFNFGIDDVDTVQSKPKTMEEAMNNASYALVEVADKYVANLQANVASSNTIGTTVSPKTFTIADAGYYEKAYEYLVDLSVVLDEANVPAEGRWVIIPPFYEGMMLKDKRFVGNGTAADRSTLANGQIGEAAGFRVLKSNNVPSSNSTTAFKIIAGHKMAWSFAAQIMKTEAYRPEKKFNDAVKGLYVYGAKLVRPQAIAVLTCNKPS